MSAKIFDILKLNIICNYIDYLYINKLNINNLFIHIMLIKFFVVLFLGFGLFGFHIGFVLGFLSAMISDLFYLVGYKYNLFFYVDKKRSLEFNIYYRKLLTIIFLFATTLSLLIFY